MTSPNVAVKHFVQEFLYLACNEDCLPLSTPSFFPFILCTCSLVSLFFL